MKTVKELKQEIDKVIKSGYTYKTYLSWPEHLIDISNSLGIGTKLVQVGDKMIYEFIVDTQFLRSQEITYDEIAMCKDIMEILENNRKFILKRLKKYTVEEYKQKQLAFQRRQEDLMKLFELLVHEKKTSGEENNYEFVEDKIDIEVGEV